MAKHGMIQRLAALIEGIWKGSRREQNKPLSVLDDFRLADLGITREQAAEIDERNQRRRHKNRSRPLFHRPEA